jgi:hypothetical protein
MYFLLKIVKSLLSNMHISISNEANSEIFQIHSIKELNAKFSFISKNEAYYKICIEKTNVYWSERDPIWVSLKIMSDNMDEPNISSAVKKQDLDPLHEKLSKAIKKGERIIKQQENELDQEDNVAHNQMRSINGYYKLAIIQVIIILGLGIYQIYSFRKFISNNQGSQI